MPEMAKSDLGASARPLWSRTSSWGAGLPLVGVTISPLIEPRACASMCAGIREGEVKEAPPIMSVAVYANWRNLAARDDEIGGIDSNGRNALHSADVKSGVSRAGGPKDDVRSRRSRRAGGQRLDVRISAARRWKWDRGISCAAWV